jgi:PGF-pre-PGF domain-containing protein
MEPSQGNTDSIDTLPTSLGEVKNFFDTEDANQNASFQTKDTGDISDSGELDTDIEFDKSGAYALFLTTGDAVSANNGDIEVSGETTIIGMDAAIVEEQPADVTDKPSSVVDGNTASFTVDTPSAENTNVSVVLYDTSKWTGSNTVMRITEKINSDLTGEDITIDSSIGEVNGEAELADSYSMFGIDVGPATQAGSFSAGSIIQALTDEADDRTDRDVTEPNVDAGSTVLDASMVTKVEQKGPVTVDLQTYENWSTGQYTWVTVTGGHDAGDIQTETGTLNVKEERRDPGPGPDPSPDPSPPTDDDPVITDPPAPPVVDPEDPDDGDEVSGAAPGSSVTEDRGAARVNISGTTPGSEVTVNLPTNESEIERTGVGLTQMRLNTTTNTSASMTIRSNTTAQSQVSPESDLGYIEIDDEISPDTVSSATYTFTVTNQRLEERGVAPENVALYRFEDGGWNELDTTLVSSTSTRHTYEAESPGLSLYAISAKGAAQPDMQVTDASVEPTTITTSDSVEVTATIENTGNAQGSFDAVLQIDGSDVSTQSVTVNAGQTTTVTFDHTFDATGDYTVAVSGTDAGTVEVTAEDTDTTTTPTTTTTTTTPTDDQDDDDDGGNLPLIIGITVVAIGIIVVLIYLYNEGYFEE